jgi:O-antigen/teichoic acid export membrane protein
VSEAGTSPMTERSPADLDVTPGPLPGGGFAGSVRQRLLRGSAWTMFGRVLAIVLGIVINALLARLLTPEELGGYFAVFTLVFVGSIVGRVGMDRAAVRFVSTALATGQEGRARHAVISALLVGTAGAIVVGLVLMLGVGTWLAERVLDSDAVSDVIPLAAVWLLFTTLKRLLVETFRAFQRFDLATVFDSLLTDVLAASVFGALLLVRGRSDLSQVVALSTVFAAAAASVAAGLVIRRVRALPRDGRVSRAELVSMSWPVVVADVASYLLGTGVDLWILAAFRPLSEVALYGAASRLILFVVLPFQIVQGVTPPLIAELHAQGKRHVLQEALRASAFLAAIPAFILLIVFTLFGSFVLELVYGSFYAQAATILAILSAGRLFAVWTGSCGLTLMMTGHQRAMMYITLLSGIVSVVGATAVAPRFGGLGVAVTTASAAVLQNLLQLLLAKRFAGLWTHAYLSPGPPLRYLLGRDHRTPREVGP